MAKAVGISQGINSLDYCLSHNLFWHIYEVKHLPSPKHSFQVRRVPRVCNSAADALAKYSARCKDFYFWLEDFLPHLCFYL